MPTKTIKISDENYRWLSSFAGELQRDAGRSVSIDEALGSMRRSNGISALAGSWKMSGKEARKIQAELRNGWKRWRIGSA